MRWPAALSLALMLGMARVTAEETGHTVGVTFISPNASAGYTLYAPLGSTRTYLINREGELVQRWVSNYRPGASAYLLENGHLFRAARYSEFNTFNGAGAEGGRVEEYAWDGQLLWSYNYQSAEHRQHHDAIKLPNGNVLMIAWETRTRAQALAAGRDPLRLAQNELWPCHLVEIEPSGVDGGSVVWEWHAWDHLIQDYDAGSENYGVVAEHPELIDLNVVESDGSDWLHMNGLDYDPATEQVLISVHHMKEIWIVDHSTTTAEARGHTGGRYGKGGDLLYRWGNPQNYDRGTPADQKLFGQHNAQWIRPGLPGAGHILIFNNGGYGRPPYSTVDEIIPPMSSDGYSLSPGEAYGPTELAWTYIDDPATHFFSAFISGCQRLPNGNTFVCSGSNGRFFEVTDSGETVWNYLSPVAGSGALIVQGGTTNPGGVFRSPHYAPDYAGLAGKVLTSQGTVELPVEQTLRVAAFTANRPGPQLSWFSLPDREYTVRYKQRLTDPSWSDIQTVSSLGTLTTFLDPEPSRFDGPSAFYRVELKP